MCNTSNIKALELYCNIKKWNIELDTLIVLIKLVGTIKQEIENVGKIIKNEAYF